MGQIEKQLKGKVVFKHETEAVWHTSNNGGPVEYVPAAGEKILYDRDNNHNYTRIKYGDGTHIVAELPFSTEQSDWSQTDETAIDHIKNKPDLSTVATSGSYNDLTDTPVITNKMDSDGVLYLNTTNTGSGGGSGGSADNGFNLAKINMTSDSGGTIEMLIGTFENAMTNPASLVLVLEDFLFFTYKGINFEPVAGIYECTTNTPAGQVVYRCTLSTDGTCHLEEVHAGERSFGTIILDEETFSKLYLSGESVTGSIPSVSNAILDYLSFGIILEIKKDEWISILLLLTFSKADVLGESFACVYEGCCELSDLGALCVRCVLRKDGTYILSRVLSDE